MAYYGMPENMHNDIRLHKMEYLQSMYPINIKKLHQYVVEICDRLDYPGSPIYDQYPDRLILDQMVTQIYNMMPDEVRIGFTDNFQVPGEQDVMDEVEVEVYETSQGQQMQSLNNIYARRPPGPGRRPPGPPPGKPCHRPPHNRNRWLDDVITVLLLNEIQRRNCRSGYC